MPLQKLSEKLWIYDGEVVSFYGLPYSTRMTVIKLNNDLLWIHSPAKLNHDLLSEIGKLGRIGYLIAPNKLHHLYLSEWLDEFPAAECHAAPGLIDKRKDITFTKKLTDQADPAWQEEIGQTLFDGSFWMEEVVFFHRSSKTLILTDLIENFSPHVFNGWQLLLAKATGIVSPNGKTPIDWRLSFFFGKSKAGKALETILNWQPENIIISHGECIFGNGEGFLEQSFSWLK